MHLFDYQDSQGSDFAIHSMSSMSQNTCMAVWKRKTKEYSPKKNNYGNFSMLNDPHVSHISYLTTLEMTDASFMVAILF